MKKNYFHPLFLIISGYFLLGFSFSHAANPGNAPEDFSAVYTINNQVLVSDRVLEFDLYLKATNEGKPFELSIIQAGVYVNSAILNGGNITASLISGFSELISSQQPTNIIFVNLPGKSIVKVAGKIGPGGGNGTKIKSSGDGTRICRIRLTNTVPFAKERADLTFCFTTEPYPTKVFFYDGRTSYQLPTDAKNCMSKADNPLLNQ